ncbi:hypothetical protein K3G63_09060 [Hymenobacter sp. HSC-4F20]|uniref:hypothetical protein n=1 Tax=Hymenobacter sp. HSC-4F20 TaxID=2864135 RepID=UPI001C72CCBE|nr:hypothetical protein [Hymenobacter sp. HSC-4F20]MBX0290584.1 hypothetical protein [Hymenobacter sp. HSC-4F20]
MKNLCKIAITGLVLAFSTVSMSASAAAPLRAKAPLTQTQSASALENLQVEFNALNECTATASVEVSGVKVELSATAPTCAEAVKMLLAVVH